MRILIILTVFIGGCASSSMTGAISTTNKDVVILSLLVQDHLRKTDGRELDLTELLEADTSHRISDSFEKLELKSKAGHISVYYQFSKSRVPARIELSEKEKQRAEPFGWKQKALKNQYDGEIQFDYGERFYRLRKIITKGP